jgi:type VI protein secretion system component VasK
MPVVGVLCFAVAYVSYEEAHKNSTLNWILWATGVAALGAAVLSILPLVNLQIVLPFMTINGLTLIIGFVCLLIAYLKTWRR